MAPTTGAPVPKARALPQKEGTLFKSVLQLYETRQFKKALKVADQILKKVPDHGETTSMKGLVLSNMNRKEEGLELVKKGIRLDLSSHICWHVYGIIQKADRHYEEALKSYLQALRFDKDNQNILRDAAQLQTQLRNYEGLQETRLTLLKLRPTVRLNWIGLAAAYHLGGQPEDARNVLDNYIKTLKNIPNYDFEYSELLLYYLRILEELEQYSEALQILDTNAKSRSIVDKTAIMQLRARLLTKQGQTVEAGEAWQALLEHNPENHDWYREYLSNRGIDLNNLTDETTKQALGVIAELEKQSPNATTPKRLALQISSGEEFKTRAEAYLLSGLKRGIPSLFSDLKDLYANPSKEGAIREIAEEFCASVAPKDLSQRPSGDTDAEEVEPPTTYLWILYFLAQHHSHISPTSPTKALEYLEKAIDHTPTLPELYMTKARTLKRAGDPIGASVAMEVARKMDLQDRFLNTKSAKYLLRDGHIEEAQTILGLFTKKEALSPAADLEDMQSLLYLVEEGCAFDGLEKLSYALKRYKVVEKTFCEFEDDQFDFHSYCLRRHTLTAYEGLLTFEDKLRSHPAYQAAALSAARIYVRIHDDPALIAANAPPVLTGDAKKAKKKAKKAAAKTPAPAANAADDSKDDNATPLPPKDEDPDGMKALSISDPLEQAAKLLKPLEHLKADQIEVWSVVFDVAIRRKKFLQALRALEMMRKVDSDDPSLHCRLVEFKHALSSLPTPLASHVEALTTPFIQSSFPSDISPEQYTSEYLQRHSDSPEAILSHAKALFTIRGEGGRDAIDEVLLQLAQEHVRPSIKIAKEALHFLRHIVKSSRTDALCTALSTRYPLSTFFKTDEEKKALRAAQTTEGESEEGKEELEH